MRRLPRTISRLLPASVLVTVAASAPAADEIAGKALFVQKAVPACAVCHTLKDAGAEGAIGPSLDELKPDAARVAKAMRDGIGQMPSYKGALTEAQIEAVAAYVARATSGRR